MIALSFIALVATALISNAQGRHVFQHKHEAVNVKHNRRQAGPPIQASPAAVAPSITVAPTIYIFITPSPGAKPVPVTKESQLVSTFVPQFTLCELPPIEFFPVSAAPRLSASLTASYKNYSVSIPAGNGTCTTIFSPTQTMVCATTLSDLVANYTVSSCLQDITFSTEYGYVLAYPTSSSSALDIASKSSVSGLRRRQATASAPATAVDANASSHITPAPTIQTLTTYYIAPWQSLTAGTAPSNVHLKVCTTFPNGTYECVSQYQVWHTSLVTITETSTIPINISTTIHGLSQIIVETFVANVTEHLTTFSMSTTLELEYQTEFETTHTSDLSVSTGPTITLTRSLELASPMSHTTRTSTVKRTSTKTIYVGTSTATVVPVPAGASSVPEETKMPAPGSPIVDGGTSVPAMSESGLLTPTTSVDFASILGINEVPP